MKISESSRAYTFDDVVLIPNHSTVKSRKDPDVTCGSKYLSLEIPIISAPMNTVTEITMAKALADCGGIGVVHRFMDIDCQLDQAIKASKNAQQPFFAVGANHDLEKRIEALYKHAGVKRYCIDIANGHSDHCLAAIELVKRMVPDALIMAGNVCTEEGARRIAEAGAHLIRIGIGPGAVCKTREVTGHGLPQLSAIQECYEIKKSFPDVILISDGGIRQSGDIVKSLGAGADTVMIGSLLAGTMESPGEIIEENGRLVKYYHGMASEAGRKTWFNRDKSGFVPEGISIKIPYLGKSAVKVIEGLIGGLKVGMSYSGAHNLAELREKARWAIVSPAGYIEGTPHGISRT